MYYLNKIVGAFLNPLGIGLILLLASLVCAILKRRHPTSTPCGFLPTLFLLFSFFWLWVWSTGVMGRMIGLPLEREFPPQMAEQMPKADAIVVLGGGTWMATNVYQYAETFAAGDRVLHAWRLYKAGKAPKVFVTAEADAFQLAELGVPREAIAVNDEARNTEEETLFLQQTLKKTVVGGKGLRAKPKVLLVTSAWHMRRAKLMYEKYAKDVEVITAATDYETLVESDRPLDIKDFVPDPAALGRNAALFKEWLAYYGYYFLRK